MESSTHSSTNSKLCREIRSQFEKNILFLVLTNPLAFSPTSLTHVRAYTFFMKGNSRHAVRSRQLRVDVADHLCQITPPPPPTIHGNIGTQRDIHSPSQRDARRHEGRPRQLSVDVADHFCQVLSVRRTVRARRLKM